ncbi:MAG: PilZ domain-containing protein [Deltaproteobacteria bacterium]|nr:PilZ domain-containing protein [Deltaproteobacteria bacterium]
MLGRTTSYVDNPRRFPRVPARLRVVVSARGEGFEAETEDLGPGGCLVLLPRPLVQGVQVRVALDASAVPERLSVVGHVAWARAGERIRAGVAFDLKQPGAVRPQAWFQKLMAADPAMASRISRAPERIAVDAPLYLLPPPRRILDILPGEAALLRRLDNGVTPRQLLAGTAQEVVLATRHLFSLFEKRVLTLALGQSAPAWQWRETLARLEDEGAIERVELEDIGEAAAPLDPPRPVPPPAIRSPPLLHPEALAPRRSAPAPRPRRPDLPSLTPAPVLTPSSRPTPPPVSPPAPPPVARPAPPPVVRSAPEAPTPAPLVTGAESRPERASHARPPQAQQCLDLAKKAAEEGNYHTAIGLLRRGLQIAPRDPEIADLLGRFAFRGRGG